MMMSLVNANERYRQTFRTPVVRTGKWVERRRLLPHEEN